FSLTRLPSPRSTLFPYTTLFRSQLAEVAGAVDKTLASFGIPKEQHAFSPHLTLARGGRGSGAPTPRRGDQPNTAFRRLQEKLALDRKSTRLNSSHLVISYAVFCL